MENEKNQAVINLDHLSSALERAVTMRFMSPEHGANVWKDFLRKSGLDVAKKLPEQREIERR